MSVAMTASPILPRVVESHFLTLCQSFLRPFAFGKLTSQWLVRGLQAQVLPLVPPTPADKLRLPFARVCAQLFASFFLFQCLLLSRTNSVTSSTRG